MPPKNPVKLTVSDFIHQHEVIAELESLKKTFDPAASGGRPLIVSDVLDADGHQYVNLVQKGGGVFGIALVGYTYILEEMGIRFLRLAGTSAGAINTALITVIKNKSDKKSAEVLQAICDLDFFSLVDGHPAARTLIKNFITRKNYIDKAKNKLLAVLAAFALLIVGDVVLVGLSNKYPALYVWTGICFILSGFLSLVIGIGVSYMIDLFKRLKNSGYGINPGDVFYDWIKRLLLENQVATVSDLNRKAAICPALQLRVPNQSGLEELKGDVTFIASELVTQNKIQFPAMCSLFRTDVDTLSPAGFIRASMSIPLFFESYMINDIPANDIRIKDAWKKFFGITQPPSTARFVDGGILSNFPISIFFNPNVTVPRLPSFGIDLDDSKPADKQENAFSWSLTGYFGRMFNTIRNYYDKDFLLKNEVYQRGVGKVDLSSDQYNWLNFFLSDKDKIDMFVLGAKAACEFLRNFDWETYKNDRTDLQIQLKK
ncbi:patatin-like phospholipase family protein [Chitinophaga sp. RCC_12]|uniref:patatin-like phospholipase family protein n=1 Tax=Chitinophaga sp. RCC_12 TaxID=3239226 RepID=UPI0035249C45